MGLFRRSNKLPGWLTIGFYEDGVGAVHVRRVSGAAPKVESAGFFAADNPPTAAQLEKIAKDLRAERHACSAVLNAGEYQILSVEAPTVPAEELKAAIRWRLKDMLDFHVDDATVDVLDIPPDKNAPVRAHSMFAVVARNQVIAERQGLLTQAKFPLSVIDIPDMAQRNLSVLMEPEARGLAMLALDADGGLLTVTFGGELYLSRRIDVTAQQLAEADFHRKEALLGRIALEVQRSLDHFDRQYHFITLAKVVVFPAGQLGAQLHEYIKGNLDMPTELLKLEEILDLSGVPELAAEAAQVRFFKLLGAALRLEEKAL